MSDKLKLSTLFIVIISLASLVGLSYYRATGLYNFINSSIVFEIALFGSFLVIKKRANLISVILAMAFLFYLFYSFVVSQLISSNHVGDFLIIYKSLLYLVLLLFCSRSSFIGFELLYTFFKFILVVFFVKYLVWHFIGPTNRPGVFTENNFEIPFLLLLYACVIDSKFNLRNWVHIVTFIVVMLSVSASGILAYFAVVFIFLNLSTSKKAMLFLMVGPALIMLVYIILMSKISDGEANIESIDRVVFFLSFIKATHGWGVFDYMIGSQPITPLSADVCDDLSYYQTLFSFKNDGSCYSNVLHSYFLKTLYDHGFIGLLCVLLGLLVILRASHCSLKLTLSTFVVVVVSAMSISSLNSPYVALAIFILVGVNNERYYSCCSTTYR